MDQSCLIKRQSEKQKNIDQTRHFSQFITIKKADWYMIICGVENGFTYQSVLPILLLTRCSGTLSESCLTGSNWYGCILVGLSGFFFGARAGHFTATPQSDVVHMILASWRRFSYERKCLFSSIYYLQITISPTSSFSGSFNGNRVKNHPKPWTCPLITCFLLF